ncbi:Beta-lactamase [Jannaschia faecimaris]|uniref:Beta-lactamase n=1 Tax=Jannaschia faecimaris TaxID=1244108 RepID=A0A1H3MK19_9RHOB|nr:serine hydrolase domain-containing protein [Jannaschia faecimaris]SDY76445.1 Beta-lactamase [Jannaschia faecimaris]
MTVFTARLTADGHLTGADAPPLPWWSFSKTVIAALLVGAAARGEVDLDSPCPGHEWTLRDLLGHRAGLGDYFAVPAYHRAIATGGPIWTPADFLRVVPPDKPDTPPGTRFAYSNIGYLLARQALETVTGQPLAALLNRLTAPLGLTSVRLAQTAEDFADLPFPAGGYHPGWVAHGCLMGTPSDAVRLLRAILHDPALTGMQIALPVDANVAGRPWTETGYGLGLMIGRVGPAGRAIGHSGGGPFSANAVYAFPDCPGTPVVATFVAGGDEAPAEHAALRMARALKPGSRHAT